MSNQDGLEWIEGTFGLEPRWTKEPDIKIIESLARKHLKLDDEAECRVSFHAQGGFNKLYKVDTKASSTLMRVALPVDPSDKTSSEVATIEFVRRMTEIPVSKIFAFDASNENELGFEWILMEMMPGATLRSRWRKLSLDAKKQLVRRIAKYQVQLFGSRFSKIGNIFERSGDVESLKEEETKVPTSRQSQIEIGRIVSLEYFWGDRLSQDIPRGPFANSLDWLQGRLKFILNDQERILQTSQDEDEVEDAEDVKEIVKRLLVKLPDVFPKDEILTENTILFHNDLSLQNILVDDTGSLTAIIDWECVSVLPLWKACQIPAFLEGPNRDEVPIRESYAAEEPEEENKEAPKDALDNEGVNSLYWEHLMDYERTVLRRFFIEEMARLAPSWTEEFEKSSLKADIDFAVQSCDGMGLRTIKQWLDSLQEGEVWSLRERLLN